MWVSTQGSFDVSAYLVDALVFEQMLKCSFIFDDAQGIDLTKKP